MCKVSKVVIWASAWSSLGLALEGVGRKVCWYESRFVIKVIGRSLGLNGTTVVLSLVSGLSDELVIVSNPLVFVFNGHHRCNSSHLHSWYQYR